TIKVGVEGRVLVGPKGKAGNVEVPLRVALVQEGPQPKPIWTKFYSVPLNIPQGQTQMTFTHVEDDLSFAIPANKDLSNHVIYVGYDPLSAGKGTKKKEAPVASTPKTTKSAARPKATLGAPPPAQQMTPASTQPTFAPVSPRRRPALAPPPHQPGWNGYLSKNLWGRLTWRSPEPRLDVADRRGNQIFGGLALPRVTDDFFGSLHRRVGGRGAYVGKRLLLSLGD